MTEDLTKMPKWAQEKIRVLEMRNAEMAAKLEAGPEGANVFADPYSDHPRPIGRNTTIKIIPAQPSEWHGLAYNIRPQPDGTLEIAGGNSIEVRPNSANSITIDIVTSEARSRAEMLAFALEQAEKVSHGRS